jgi:hypothetical protein
MFNESINFNKPMCAKPFAPPPLKHKPTFGRVCALVVLGKAIKNNNKIMPIYIENVLSVLKCLEHILGLIFNLNSDKSMEKIVLINFKKGYKTSLKNDILQTILYKWVSYYINAIHVIV